VQWEQQGLKQLYQDYAQPNDLLVACLAILNFQCVAVDRCPSASISSRVGTSPLMAIDVVVVVVAAAVDVVAPAPAAVDATAGAVDVAVVVSAAAAVVAAASGACHSTSSE
jgi:hypothetical protein